MTSLSRSSPFQPGSASPGPGFSFFRIDDSAGFPRATLRIGDVVGEAAVRALCEEAKTAPKPGLVDPFHNGAHRDMDYSMFLVSAHSLGSYFSACAMAGYNFGARLNAEVDPAFPILFSNLRALGREAECMMFRATRGVNTHKGAIFTLGLLCAAAGLSVALSKGQNESLSDPAEICFLAGRICKGVSALDFSDIHAVAKGRSRESGLENSRNSEECLTAGEKLYLRFGVKGIRGEAEAGFPVLRSVVLPRLQEGGSDLAVSLARNGLSHERESLRLDALLASMSVLEDSCLLARGGPEGLAFIRSHAETVLAAGGARSVEGRRFLCLLDKDCCERNLSPGGSADMLAAGIFLSTLCVKDCPA